MGCDSRPRARAKPLAGRCITHSKFKRAKFSDEITYEAQSLIRKWYPATEVKALEAAGRSPQVNPFLREDVETPSLETQIANFHQIRDSITKNYGGEPYSRLTDIYAYFYTMQMSRLIYVSIDSVRQEKDPSISLKVIEKWMADLDAFRHGDDAGLLNPRPACLKRALWPF
jgi:hypothetical protein